MLKINSGKNHLTHVQLFDGSITAKNFEAINIPPTKNFSTNRKLSHIDERREEG